MKIGIFALQGDFEAHLKTINSLGVDACEVRDENSLASCDGLIIPGGESTTMSRLCDRYNLWEPLQAKIQDGMGILGTCAGLIMMAKNITGSTRNFQQKTLGVLDIDVARNAYGAQLDSFETDVEAPELGETPLRAVFIRAPQITRVGKGVDVLASHSDAPVVVGQGRFIGTAFHPEIAGESRIHQVWLERLGSSRKQP